MTPSQFLQCRIRQGFISYFLKMKIAIVVSVLLLGIAVESAEEIDLRTPIQEISQLIDWESIEIILEDVNVLSCINQHDPKIIPYLKDEDFSTIHHFLWTHPQFLKIIHFIADGGYPEIYQGFNDIYDFFGLRLRVDENGPAINDEPVIVQPLNPAELCENAQEILELVRLAFPEEELVETVFNLIKTNPSVKALVELVKQPESKQFVNELIELPEMQRLIEYGKSKNVPIHEMMYFVK